MSTFAIQIIAIGLVAVHLRAPLRVSVAALVTSTFLIPGTILFPEAPAYMFVLRIGLWSAAVGMFVRAATGEIPPSALRPSRVFVAFALFIGMAYFVGVAAGPYPSQSERAFELWLLLFDQLLFLWVATAAVRVLGVRFVALSAAVGVVGVACVAIVERWTGASYAHWWFRHQKILDFGGQPLEVRGGEVRVRASGEFALQFAWVLAFFMPMVALLALRAKRVVALAAPGVVAVAAVATVTRSVFAGLAVGALALLMFARGDRRLVGSIALTAVAAGVIYLGSGTVREPFRGADPESELVRARRLSILTNELARQPWTGLGLDGAAQRGITSTDSALLATYAGAGALGVAALVGLIGTAAFTALSAGVIAEGAAAPMSGAVLGGLGAGALGMFAFDSLSGPLASWNLWLLAALAVGLYEEAEASRPGPLRPRSVRLSRRRLALPALGLLVGTAAYLAAPTHVASQLRIFTLSPNYLTRTDSAHADFVGRVLVQATCDAARSALAGTSVRFDCFDPLQSGPGTGLVRIEARSRKTLAAAHATFVGVSERVSGTTRVSVVSPPLRARPTWARTAPVTVTLLFAEVALLVPPIRLRRRVPSGRSLASGRLSPAYR
ncbi:MAG TPA: hypothetical protein VMZ22_00880 [Acidimicrobiales bacterium]|nr:hypothetical protein [Acidimicrobiales bacterium]